MRVKIRMKHFIITVDTEGDYIWHTVHRSYGVREITVENAKYIERFQKLCQKYHFIPTYLVNYEMAFAEPFVSFAREWAKSGKCEIGMHLHAWNTPPIFDFPYRRKSHNPYAGDYPPDVLFQKMRTMTEVIESKFGIQPVSHRCGRWYLDENVIRFLSQLGYIVDCSVTPGVSWETHIGYMMYGSDYTNFPMRAFCLKADTTKILEVPPSIVLKKSVGGLQDWCNRIFFGCKEKPIAAWLRPNGRNLEDMLRIVAQAESEDSYLEFMIHSSELMPGGSPTFPNKISIEKLYRDMDELFERISDSYSGIALKDFANKQLLLANRVYLPPRRKKS